MWNRADEMLRIDASTRLRDRRSILLQHERLQRQPMHHHLRRIRCWQDGSREADNAVHCERIGGQQLVDPGDQGHGAGDESPARVLR